MGQVVGESAEKVDVPKTTPITPQDLMATVFQVLGIEPRLQGSTPDPGYAQPFYLLYTQSESYIGSLAPHINP